MGDLFWPGDDRAGDHFTSASFLAVMVLLEAEWADVDLSGVDAERHLEWLENESESGGNPVIGLVELLREATGDTALHRGLTSQDVVDTALMRMAEAAVADLLADLDRIVAQLAELATEHRDTPMVARTLTQHAIPTTFGFRVAQWLTGVLDARDDVRRLRFPDQLGGAAGTRAGMVELGLDLPLDDLPWHTTRATVTRIGDALAGCTDACARIANDVLALGRPEIGELAEGSGGGSSTMPNKANPVLSVLIRRAALTTPQLAATLHLAAASQVDDRADGGWHAEWAPLRDLVRRTLVAVSQTHDLLDGLEVRPDRMAWTLAGAGDDVLAEQRALAKHAGHDPAPSYLGQAGAIIDAVVARSKETR